jgi:CHASE2 domain-containing sensor protein
MNAAQTLTFVLLGALLGAAGQGARVVVGLKKEIVDARGTGKTVAQWFDGRELLVSFVLGSVAGIIAAIWQYGPDVLITKNLLLGFAAAGYAGADFIGGLMEKWIPAKPAAG